MKVFLFNNITFRSIPNLFEPKGRTRVEMGKKIGKLPTLC